MNKELQEKMVAEAIEKQLATLGLTEVVRKLKFEDKKPGDMSKEEKTMKFFKAQIDGDMSIVKALSGGTSDSGQTLLPIEFQNDVIDRVVKDIYALRSYCTQIPVTYRSGFFPVGASGVVMSWDGENTPMTETTPTFGQLNYGVNRLDGLTAMSRELLNDTPVNLYNYLAMQYAKAFTKAENAAIINGSGTNQPLGIRIDTGVIVKQIADTTTGILKADDIIGLPFALDINYRQGCVFILDSTVMAEIRLLKDNYGRYLFEKGDPTQGVPDTLAGYKVLEFTNVIPSNLTVGSLTNTTEIIFGNLENYYFFDKHEMGSEVTTQSDTAFKNHQAIMKMWERIDGKAAIPSSFVRLKGIK